MLVDLPYEPKSSVTSMKFHCGSLIDTSEQYVCKVGLLHTYREHANDAEWRFDFNMCGVPFGFIVSLSSQLYSREVFLRVLSYMSEANLFTSKDSCSLNSFCEPVDLQPQDLPARSLSQTNYGGVGLRIRHMLPGGQVVPFDGENTPFVLRREIDESRLRCGRYKLVSDYSSLWLGVRRSFWTHRRRRWWNYSISSGRR